MESKIKKTTKKVLVFVGLRHPAKGIKMVKERKAEVLLMYKTPVMDTFIETGTNKGEMIDILRNDFKVFHSIELNKVRYNGAIQKFKDEKNIHIYHGDSGKELPKILKKVSTPALIWLDAHDLGSISFKNSPIELELQAIFNHSVKGFAIIIDDARHFSMEDIRKIKGIANLNNYNCTILEGLFRLTEKD